MTIDRPPTPGMRAPWPDSIQMYTSGGGGQCAKMVKMARWDTWQSWQCWQPYPSHRPANTGRENQWFDRRGD